MNGAPPYTTAAWRVSDGRTYIHPPRIDLSALSYVPFGLLTFPSSNNTRTTIFTSENERDKLMAKRKRRSERERAKRRREKLLGDAQGNGLYRSNELLNFIGDTAGRSRTPVYPSRILEENGDKSSANTPLEISAPHVRRETPHPRREAPRRDEYFYLETVTFQVIYNFFFVIITVKHTSPPFSYYSLQGWKHPFQGSQE